jgi:hypothetical protein
MTGLPRVTLWFVLAPVGLLVGGVGQARADLTLTLTDPNPTVVRPTSGSVSVDFEGTITWSLTGPSSSTAPVLAFPFKSDRHALQANLLVSDIDIKNLINASGPSFTGSHTVDLFSVTVDATSPLGLYDLDSGLAGPPTLEIFVVAPDGFHIARSSYSVNVVNAAVVPEPATHVVALSEVALIGLGLAWRRRRAAA